MAYNINFLTVSKGVGWGHNCTHQYFVLLFLQELEVTAKILLAKGGETSGFIRDDVEKALTAMVCSLTPTRVLVSLISGGARSVPIETHQHTI